MTNSLVLQVRKFINVYKPSKAFLKKLILLNLLSSIFDLIGVVSIIPLLSTILSKESKTYILLENICAAYFGISDSFNVVLLALIGYLLIILFNTVIRVYVLNRTQLLISKLSTDVSVILFSKTLHEDFEVLSSKHSSEIIGDMTLRLSVFTGYISSIAIITNSLLISIGLLFTMFFILPMFVFPFLGLIFGIYFVLNKKLKNRIIQNSKIALDSQNKLIVLIQNSIGSIRDVIIANRFDFFVNNFGHYGKVYNDIQAKNHLFGHSPRYILEFVGSLIIVMIILGLMLIGADNDLVISKVALVVVSFQRLLPSIQAIYQNVSSMQSVYFTITDLLNILEKKVANYFNESSNLFFTKSFKISDLTFSYKMEKSKVLDNVSLEFRKGDKIGIVGKTGSGKSTLVDLIMGLIKQRSGSIYVDDVLLNDNNLSSWRSKISFVPQKIFLFDATVAENIAFGVDASFIDYNLVVDILKKIGLYDYFNSKPEGINYVIGEDGIKLSGGQRQRIAIARALYAKSSVIIFDEATSALDMETEAEIVNVLSGLSDDLTQIYITHRPYTLDRCNLVFKVDAGQVKLMKQL